MLCSRGYCDKSISNQEVAGVSATESSLCVKGLELTAASMLIKVVFKCSSVCLDCPNTFHRQRFTHPIILSHHPPHQTARGAIYFQIMSLRAGICGP